MKFEETSTGCVAYTTLHCSLLDAERVRCGDYARRSERMPDCVPLTPAAVRSMAGLPESCAYRRVAEGRGLPPWHPLVCGDPDRIHREGHSIRGRTTSASAVPPEEHEDWVVDWEGNPP